MILDEFLEDLRRLGPALNEAIEAEMWECARDVKRTAQGYLGNYQSGFTDVNGTIHPAWEPLTPATIERKEAGDTPLLETHVMEDSVMIVQTRSEGGRVVTWHIGSHEDRAKWMELGTVKTPPRPWLSMALAARQDDLVERLDQVVGETIDRVFGL